MRTALKGELIKLEVKGNWDHITNQIGMFSYTGLNEKQCTVLIQKYHIYLLKNGRISMVIFLEEVSLVWFIFFRRG